MNDSTPVYRIGVISDTHGKLSNQVFDLFSGVNLILHAGDIGREDVLIALETIAPVTAVSGNVDGFSGFGGPPMTRELTTPLGRIAMTHGHLHGAPSADKPKLVRYFSQFKPEIVVFGHSHIPFLEEQDGVTLFNPGSASLNRWGSGNSVGMITLPAAGACPVFEHLMVV
jgi:putative phosphoesterase